MILTEEQKQRIVKDLTDFADIQYANNDKKERQKLGQFFTPPQLAIRMIEKFTSINDDDILDPCVGSGNLLVGCIIAGADPKRCYGIELDENQAEICRNRLENYGVPRENIITGSCLDDSVMNILKEKVK